MREFELNCQESKRNTGIQRLCPDFFTIQSYILVPDGFSITEEDAKDPAIWLAKIHADKSARIYPFPAIFNHDPNLEESQLEEGTLGTIKTRDGKITYVFHHRSSRTKHSVLKTHDGHSGGVVFVDVKGNLQGVNNAGMFEGIPLSLFDVGQLQGGSADAVISIIRMTLEDSTNFHLNPATILDVTGAKSWKGLTDLNLTLIEATGSAIEVEATHYKSTTKFVGDEDDFIVLNSQGAAQTITSVTESTDGNNVLNFTSPLTAGAYTVDLKAPKDTLNGFESTGSVEVTISA